MMLLFWLVLIALAVSGGWGGWGTWGAWGTWPGWAAGAWLVLPLLLWGAVRAMLLPMAWGRARRRAHRRVGH